MPQQPTLESHPATGDLRAIALFCHGGTATSEQPPRDYALSLIRMRAIEQFVRGTTAERGVATFLLRYRVAGWNGSAADAFNDVRWALEQLRADYGAEVPMVLIGHSMGGRAALRAGGDDQVAAVCALAPWTPPQEPVDHLRGRTVTVLHGTGDRWVPAALSEQFALRARARGVPVARFTTPGGHSMLRGAHRWHEFTRDTVLGATGIEPMRADIANALRLPVPEGIAVPLQPAS